MAKTTRRGNERSRGGRRAIVAHDNVRRRMSTEQFLDFFKMRVAASHPGCVAAQ